MIGGMETAATRNHQVRRIEIEKVAGVFIGLISFSRIYLGVHYPSAVLAGIVVGPAWVGFYMATLEAIQKFGLRRAPRILKDEKPAPGGADSSPPR